MVWAKYCFGEDLVNAKMERAYRFLEEALELGQACEVTREEAIQLVEYVYSRPVGEIPQEIGGTITTLSVLTDVYGEDLEKCSEDELNRVWTLIDKIRMKNQAKQKNSALPGRLE